jgi:hypothetical protein
MFELKILPDEDPTSPREFDNLGIMVCFHGRYDLAEPGTSSLSTCWTTAGSP